MQLLDSLKKDWIDMERNDYLIKKKYYSYLVPGVLMIVAMQLGNVVDSIIVGNILGTSALAAISLSTPVLFVLQLPAFMLGIGGSTQVSVYLGKRELKKASDMFSACLTAGFLISVLMCATAPFLSHPLAHLLAGTPELEELLYPYIVVNIYGIPFLTLAIMFSNIMNVDNTIVLGSMIFIIANIVNLGFDYLFLEFTPLGMYGAALSTIIGYTCGLVMLIPYALSKKRMLKFSFLGVINSFKEISEAVKSGVPSAMLFLMEVVKNLALNTLVVRMLGQSDMEIFSVCRNFVFIVQLFTGGIIGLVQTICGILYGEHDYYGIRRVVCRVITSCIAVSFLLSAVFVIFPQAAAGMFGYANAEYMDTALACIRLYSLSFVFFAMNKFIQTYYQTILKPFPATLDTVLQGLVVLIPITFLFMDLWKIYGVCAALVCSEILTLVIVLIYVKVQQKRGRLPQKGMLLIPEKDARSYCDITVLSTAQDAVNVSERLIDCCIENGTDRKKANLIGLAAEEIAVNISRYGYKNIKRNFIDIKLSCADGKLILRIRDDGIPFDPTQYKPEDKDTFELGGIGLLKRTAVNLSYVRVLNMNNTIIEIPVND